VSTESRAAEPGELTRISEDCGFWSIVVVVALAVSGLAVTQDNLGGGLIALGVALLCGLYAGYIFRGGRFRILFW
jgi:hypothetical protein